jgi:large exoprotein involved in heme utilization and adhesion
VNVRSPKLVALRDARMTTSVASGEGSGGNITIDPELVLVIRSEIIARADAGAGGDITIVGDEIIVSGDSVIDASSRLGISGKVRFSSPVSDLIGELQQLPAEFLDPSSLLEEACSVRDEASGSLTLQRRPGLPLAPDAQP